MRIWLLALAACAEGPNDGGLIEGNGRVERARYFDHTNCAVDGNGPMRCFSSCSPVVYGLDRALVTQQRFGVPIAACRGVVDERGGATLAGDGELIVVDRDGGFARVPSSAPMDATRWASRGGVLATVDAAGALETFSLATGARQWALDATDVHGVAFAGDAVIAGGSYFGQLALGDLHASGSGGYVAALAPDGSGRWIYAVDGGQVAALATAPSGEAAALLFAPATGWTLAMFDADGAPQWTRALELAEVSDPSVATDGTDVWLANGDAISRETSTATTWSTDATSARVLGLGDTLSLELTASEGQLALDGRTFDGDGKIIATLAR